MWLLGRRLIDAALPLNTSCLCCSISQPCITCPCSLPVQAQGEGDPRLAKRLRYLNNRAALRAAVVGGASGDGAQGSSGPRVADGGRVMGRSSSPLLGRPLAAACTPRFDSICAQLRGATPAPCLLRSLVPFRGVCTGYRKYDVRKRHTELCPSLSPHSCSHFIRACNSAFSLVPPPPPVSGVFVGYRKYDRRKQHIRELDERAAAILAAQGATSGAESEGAACGGDRGACCWLAGWLLILQESAAWDACGGRQQKEEVAVHMQSLLSLLGRQAVIRPDSPVRPTQPRLAPAAPALTRL